MKISQAHLNIAGYIPLVGTITGAFRISFGTLHALNYGTRHLVRKIRKPEIKPNDTDHSFELKYGLYNIVRGMIELVPVVATVALLIFDIFTTFHCCCCLGCHVYQLSDGRGNIEKSGLHFGLFPYSRPLFGFFEKGGWFVTYAKNLEPFGHSLDD